MDGCTMGADEMGNVVCSICAENFDITEITLDEEIEACDNCFRISTSGEHGNRQEDWI